jgi:periplasmic divalent cation tolerance protein
MTGALTVFITTPSRAEAEKIARTVVEESLAACANIFPGIQSIYRWQGKVENAEEHVLFLKSTADRFEALQARVKALHSYQCPCIVALPIVAGNEDYLKWITEAVVLSSSAEKTV